MDFELGSSLRALSSGHRRGVSIFELYGLDRCCCFFLFIHVAVIYMRMDETGSSYNISPTKWTSSLVLPCKHFFLSKGWGCVCLNWLKSTIHTDSPLFALCCCLCMHGQNRLTSTISTTTWTLTLILPCRHFLLSTEERWVSLNCMDWTIGAVSFIRWRSKLFLSFCFVQSWHHGGKSIFGLQGWQSASLVPYNNQPVNLEKTSCHWSIMPWWSPLVHGKRCIHSMSWHQLVRPW